MSWWGGGRIDSVAKCKMQIRSDILIRLVAFFVLLLSVHS